MSTLRQASGDDYPDASRKHLADSQALFTAGRYDGAGYLAGYVVECALKSLLQADCILVHAMVPSDRESATRARESFASRAHDEFSDRYFAEAPAQDDRFWDLRDLDTEDAPHVPVPLSYELKLAHFRDVADVVDLLAEGLEYRWLADRIPGRFTEVTDA